MYYKNPKKGFLLFEILVAFMIFAAGCLLMAYQQWEIKKKEQEAFDRLQAVSLARNAIENIRSKKKVLFFDQKRSKFTIKYQIESFFVPMKGLFVPKNFKLIKVMVTWESVMGMQIVRLITGFNVH